MIHSLTHWSAWSTITSHVPRQVIAVSTVQFNLCGPGMVRMATWASAVCRLATWPRPHCQTECGMCWLHRLSWPVSLMTEALLTKWYQLTPNIWHWQLMWNICSFCSSALSILHISQPYRRTDRIKALQTYSLVLRLSLAWCHTVDSLAIVLDARPMCLCKPVLITWQVASLVYHALEISSKQHVMQAVFDTIGLQGMKRANSGQCLHVSQKKVSQVWVRILSQCSRINTLQSF